MFETERSSILSAVDDDSMENLLSGGRENCGCQIDEVEEGRSTHRPCACHPKPTVDF